MIVENVPALQRWLIAVLKPLCDADPESLTKYVLALLKKNTSQEELHHIMVDQLDIFLQAGTLPFVTRLFDVIASKEYLTEENNLADTIEESPVEIETEATSDICTDAADINPTPSTAVFLDMDESATIDEFVPPSALSDGEVIDSSHGQLPDSHNNDGTQSSSVNETSDEERREMKAKALGIDKIRHCNWRDKRSRSTSSEISPRRKKNRADLRRVEGHRSRHRWSPIKRRIRRDMHRRRMSKSPRPLRSRSASQNARMRNKGGISDRSRSGSPSRRKRTTGGDSKMVRIPNPPSPSGSTCNSLLDNIAKKCTVKSVVVKPPNDANNERKEDNSTARIRCLDFDEKGLCLRGELCPYDHGLDPVVLEDVGRNDSVGITMPPNFTGKLQPEQTMNLLNPVPVRPPASGMNDEYYPESPSIVPPPPLQPFGWSGSRRPIRPRHFGMEPFMGRGGMMRPTFMRQLGPPQLHSQRQLITVPVDGVQHRGTQPNMMLMPENPFAVGGARMVCRALFGMRGRGRGTFDYGRLGSRPQKSNGSNCLEVRKIPRELNKIGTLISHFSRFGNVLSIQLAFDGDQEAALVTFESYADALNAYRSTDAVLNNRFIKVFWHTKECGTKTHDGTSTGDADGNRDPLKPAEENKRGHSFPSMPNFIPLHQERNFNTPTTSPELDTMPQNEENKPLTPTNCRAPSSPISLQTQQAVMKTPKKGNSNLASEIQRKQDMMNLLNVQIKEQKQLIAKLEVDRNRMTAKQREEVLKIIKHLQSSCEELRQNIASCSGSSGSNPEQNVSLVVPPDPEKPAYTKEEIRRKILDAELTLYMRENRGLDTGDVEKEIIQLRTLEMLLNST